MLGFQDGNEDPHVMCNRLRAMARSGDMLLSETQLFDAGNAERISEFYAHPLMQRFSRIAFERSFGGAIPSLNLFFLLPLPSPYDAILYVAVLAEEFMFDSENRHLFVSNYCLKLSRYQYKNYREHNNYFIIMAENITEDQTILFQLSRRT